MKKASIQSVQEENKKLKRKLDRLKEEIELFKKSKSRVQNSMRSEEWFRQFMQFLPQTIFEIDLEGNFKFLNDYSYKMFGYKIDDSIGNAFSMMAPSDIPRINENMRLLLQGIDNVDREFTGIKKDGTTMPVLIYARPLFENSIPVSFCGMILDITERKKMESELRESQEKYQKLTEQLPLGIYRTALDGKFLFANGASARILGFNSVNELMKINVKDIYVNPVIRQNILRSIKIGNKPTTKEISLRKKDGTIIWIRDSFILHRTIDGSLSYFEGIIEDITEKKILEEKLNQSQRLQSIGTLAGGIAHDFNNLIMGMQIYTELAMNSTAEDSPTMQSLKKIILAQIKAKNLVEQILSFSRNTSRHGKTIRILNCIESIIENIKPSLPNEVHVKCSLHECGKIKADPVVLERILTNLIQNSIQAMNEKGRLEISMRPAGTNDPIMKYKPAGRGKIWIKLTVKDDGKGMDKQTRERIFDPFFTTKKVGTGSGLGLTTVHSLVEQFGGVIFVNTAPLKGASFHIYLPSKEK